jgi:hypothetical protein
LPDTNEGEPTDPLEHSRELIRGAAKWLVASLGVIGGTLIAGSQLSSIGSLSASSVRLYVALVGLAVGLAAVLWSIWSVVGLLSPRKWTLSELAADWERMKPELTGVKGWHNHRRVINTLRQWGVRVDESFFLGGIEKARVLEALRPHIFFDDQMIHLEPASRTVSAAHFRYHQRAFSEEADETNSLENRGPI